MPVDRKLQVKISAVDVVKLADAVRQHRRQFSFLRPISIDGLAAASKKEKKWGEGKKEKESQRRKAEETSECPLDVGLNFFTEN